MGLTGMRALVLPDGGTVHSLAISGEKVTDGRAGEEGGQTADPETPLLQP